MFRSVRSRIIATFLVALAAIIIVATVIAYQYLHWYESRVTDEMGQAAAFACAAVFELTATEGTDLTPDSEYYETYRSVLKTLCKESEMAYLYAYRCDPENNTITYLICVAADEEADAHVAAERSYGTVVQAELSSQELLALEGAPTSKALELHNQFGSTLSWFNKIDGWDNVLAGADYSVDAHRARITGTILQIVAPIIIALLVLLFLQLHVLRKRVFQPIRAISEQMKAFSAKHAGEFERLNIKTDDELGEIAEAFEDMAADIHTYLSDIERMTTERVQSEVELDVARRIQLGMVPERTELADDGFEACAVSNAARAVGGDFYDAFRLDDGRIAIAVGDVSGKGVAAALFMAVAKTMVHDGLLSGGAGPAEVLNRANERLCAANAEGMFVTVFACVLDPATGEVRYANAGHMPPLVVGESARMIEVDPGVLLGLFDDASLTDGTLQLERGQSLLIYTDGVTEAVNAKRTFFGEDTLIAHLTANAPFAEAAALIDSTVSAVGDFVGDCEQFDDLTAVALTWCGADAEADLTELACDLSSFAVIREAILATSVSGELKRKTCLACEELFSNIVQYSNASMVRYSVRERGGDMFIVLEDDGAPFDSTASRPVEKDFEDLDTGGMGINLTRQLASSMTYRRENGCNILELSISG